MTDPPVLTAEQRLDTIEEALDIIMARLWAIYELLEEQQENTDALVSLVEEATCAFPSFDVPPTARPLS